MKLKDLEFLKMMPKFMQNDECIQSLCKSVDEIFRPTANDIKTLSDWDRIDSMTENELDNLAWECNITWYDKSADISAKRNICKNSDRVFMTRATAAAVEDVISTYFSNATLLEFWDAGIQPHHFKIATTDIDTYTTKLNLFLSTLEKIKRKSQWLDSIIILLSGEGKFYTGVAMADRVHSEFDCRGTFT